MKLINLLPKNRQEDLRYEAIFKSLQVIFAVGLATFVLVFMAQLGTKIYLRSQQAKLVQSIEDLKKQVDKQENADLKKQIQAINGVIGDYNNLATGAPKWSRVLKAFAPLSPEGVKISSFNVTLDKKVSITGYSPSRELVIKLYNNILNDTAHFTNVNYPLENVVKATDVSFHFNFSVVDDLLK